MTIAATPRRSPVYTGNGVATTYAFAFKVLDAATVVVTVADANDLNSVVLVNGVDYTVTLNPDQDASPGGEIGYAGLPVGHRLVITSAVDASQPTAIANLGAFHADVMEAALDRIVIQHQQQQEQLDRCVKVVATSEQDPTTLLDNAVTSASNYATAAAASASAASGSAGAASASAAAAAASAATIDTATLVKRDGSQAMTGALTVPMVVTDSPLSFRNKIINGGFDIWQRGTSSSAASVYLTCDRWAHQIIGSSRTTSRQSFAPGQTDVPGNPRYFNRTVVTSSAGAANYVNMLQPIEGVSTLAGKTATLSFWAKADVSRQIAVEFYQYFGSGGSPSVPVSGIGAQKVSLTASWQKFTITVSIPSISGETLGTAGNDFLGVLFWFDAGSNYNARTATLGQQSGTFDIANVQLEEGSAATPFEQRPLGLELQLCRRYYEQSWVGSSPAYGSNYEVGMWPVAAAGASFGIRYTVTKRIGAAPSIYSSSTGASSKVRNDTTAADVSVTGIYGTGPDGALLVVGAGTGAGDRALWHWSVDAEL